MTNLKKKRNKIKALITGVDGYLGSYIFNLLMKKKISCIGISKRKCKKNIVKWDLTKKILNLHNALDFDFIIHTASIHKLSDFKKNPVLKQNYNEKMTKNLLYLCKGKKIKNFIFFSTIDISYRNILNKKKYYNISKYNSEEVLKSAVKKGMISKLIILRLPAITHAKMSDNFLKKIIYSLKRNHNVTIFNPNNYYVNLVNINDLARLTLKIIKLSIKKSITIINCVSNRELRLLQLVEFLKKKLNSHSIIRVSKKKLSTNKLVSNQNDYNFSFMKIKKNLNFV
jgi:nucleoside-diphosphate-sugar epimerase